MGYSVKNTETCTVNYGVYIILGEPKKNAGFSDIDRIVADFGVENFREIDPYTEEFLGEYEGTMRGICSYTSGYESGSGPYSEKTACDCDPDPDEREREIRQGLETLFGDVTVMIAE